MPSRETSPLNADELLDVAALADGSIAPERRDEVAARVSASPSLSEALARQQEAISLIRGAAVSAPLHLRTRLEAQRRPQARRRRFALPALAGSAVAAVVVALVLSGGSAQPTVSDVATAGVQEPTQPAPPAASTPPAVLRRQVGGVSFPDFEKKFGWRAAGAREDSLDGRAATTVFYEKAGRRIAYTIVAGRQLEWPADGHRTVVKGRPFVTFHEGEVAAVTWREGGRTCVISGRAGMTPAELRKLAAWTV